MKVFKFGGASVKSAEAVKNVASILNLYKEHQIIVVVSAMGKMTNAFEDVVKEFFYQRKFPKASLEKIKVFHLQIIENLFNNRNHQIYNDLEEIFEYLIQYVQRLPSENYGYEYDQIVSFGELISTKIIHQYLKEIGINNSWVDARNIVKTDKTFREAKVDWDLSAPLIKKHLLSGNKSDLNSSIIITQGFIGGTIDNITTTLGREGSDYTAAIIAHAINATDVTIWKDVEGVLNADPKYFSDTKRIDEISYHEAIELAYYGATIIHPKTIKPLQNKKIPLIVKSFVNPNGQGTIISELTKKDSLIPSYIFKVNQILLSISPQDFSFIAEDNLREIFGKFAKYAIKVNVMQNSAISFSVCIDNDEQKLEYLMPELQKCFKIKYNDDLELITIRHYNQEIINKVTQGKKILMEQKSRTTVQLVVKNN